MIDTIVRDGARRMLTAALQAAPHMFDRIVTVHTAETVRTALPADAPEPGTSHREGYGIGPSLVAGIAAAHGGTVTSLDTPPGLGALVRLTLTAHGT